MRRLGKATLGPVLVAIVAYSWGSRTGQYQVERLDGAVFIVLDTSTGKHWVYRGDLDYREGKAKIHYHIEDREEAVSLWRRLLPY